MGISRNFMTEVPLKFWDLYNELKTYPIFSTHLALWRINIVKKSVNWVLINLLKIRISEVFVYNKFQHLWAMFDLLIWYGLARRVTISILGLLLVVGTVKPIPHIDIYTIYQWYPQCRKLRYLMIWRHHDTKSILDLLKLASGEYNTIPNVK